MRVEKFSERKKLEILDLEKEIGVELVAYERPPHLVDVPEHRWYVRFEHSDIKKGSFLVGMSGDGASVNDAIINYCRLISDKTMVINDMSPDKRVEIAVPELRHSRWIVTDDGDLISTSFDEKWKQRYHELVSDWLRDYLGW